MVLFLGGIFMGIAMSIIFGCLFTELLENSHVDEEDLEEDNE